MQSLLHSHEITIVLLEIGILLGLSRFLGEIARRWRQPMVVGEIIAGIILGPTVFGDIAPVLNRTVFPLSHDSMVALEGLTTIAVVLILLIAGIEINLSSVWRQRHTTFIVSILGASFSFAAGFIPAYYAPRFFGLAEGADTLAFALFVGTALCVSALPVIARMLMDMGLLKSDLGALVMASAALIDLLGLLLFSLVISMVASAGGVGMAPHTTAIVSILFTVFMLTFMRWAFHRILPWLERHTVWPGGVLGFVFACTMIGAAATEWIGVHAVFGAFLVGIAAGDSQHLSERTKDAIEQFTTNIFAPLFFASIGLRINFADNFNAPLVLAVFALASVGKIVGCTLGTRISGHNLRESLAVGMGMNTRGAMEIILGLLALEYGLITEQLFVAFVIMAVGTTIISGPLMQMLIREKKPLTLAGLLRKEGFIADLTGDSSEAAIRQLTRRAAEITDIDRERLFRATWEREQIMGTALGSGIAVPHARLLEITAPVVVVGKSAGVDFNAMDGLPVRIVFLILTPQHDMKTQLQILANIARVFTNADVKAAAESATSYDEFMQAIRRAPDPALRHNRQ